MFLPLEFLQLSKIHLLFQKLFFPDLISFWKSFPCSQIVPNQLVDCSWIPLRLFPGLHQEVDDSSFFDMELYDFDTKIPSKFVTPEELAQTEEDEEAQQLIIEKQKKEIEALRSANEQIEKSLEEKKRVEKEILERELDASRKYTLELNSLNEKIEKQDRGWKLEKEELMRIVNKQKMDLESQKETLEKSELFKTDIEEERKRFLEREELLKKEIERLSAQLQSQINSNQESEKKFLDKQKDNEINSNKEKGELMVIIEKQKKELEEQKKDYFAMLEAEKKSIMEITMIQRQSEERYNKEKGELEGIIENQKRKLEDQKADWEVDKKGYLDLMRTEIEEQKKSLLDREALMKKELEDQKIISAQLQLRIDSSKETEKDILEINKKKEDISNKEKLELMAFIEKSKSENSDLLQIIENQKKELEQQKRSFDENKENDQKRMMLISEEQKQKEDRFNKEKMELVEMVERQTKELQERKVSGLEKDQRIEAQKNDIEQLKELQYGLQNQIKGIESLISNSFSYLIEREKENRELTERQKQIEERNNVEKVEIVGNFEKQKKELESRVESLMAEIQQQKLLYNALQQQIHDKQEKEKHAHIELQGNSHHFMIDLEIQKKKKPPKLFLKFS